MNLMVIMYVICANVPHFFSCCSPIIFWSFSQLTLSLYSLQIKPIFSFLQDKVLQPHELEELFSTAPEK